MVEYSYKHLGVCECGIKMSQVKKIKDGAESRRVRIQRLKSLVAKSPDKSEATIIAVFGQESGLTKTKISEYLNELESWGIILRQNEKLIFIGDENNVD